MPLSRKYLPAPAHPVYPRIPLTQADAHALSQQAAACGLTLASYVRVLLSLAARGEIGDHGPAIAAEAEVLRSSAPNGTPRKKSGESSEQT
jgi:hypothetical protein